MVSSVPVLGLESVQQIGHGGLAAGIVVKEHRAHRVRAGNEAIGEVDSDAGVTRLAHHLGNAGGVGGGDEQGLGLLGDKGTNLVGLGNGVVVGVHDGVIGPAVVLKGLGKAGLLALAGGILGPAQGDGVEVLGHGGGRSGQENGRQKDREQFFHDGCLLVVFLFFPHPRIQTLRE